jgi:hypothetical protein
MQPVKSISKFLIQALVLTLLVSPVAFAQNGGPGTQFWGLNFVRGKIGNSDTWNYYFEVQPRFDLEQSANSRLLIRPAVIYNLDADQSLWLGALENYDFDLQSREFRTWEQYQRIDRADRVIILNRTRFEQRFKNGETDIGLRLRHMIRAQVPMGEESKWSIVVFDEAFIGMNENPSQPYKGFDQNRAFLGVRLDGNRGDFFELGYMNQYTNEAMNNIAFFTFGKIIK